MDAVRAIRPVTSALRPLTEGAPRAAQAGRSVAAGLPQAQTPVLRRLLQAVSRLMQTVSRGKWPASRVEGFLTDTLGRIVPQKLLKRLLGNRSVAT